MERLRQRADFLAAAAGARAPARGFVLQALGRHGDGPVRVGFTCSRKVGNAVERNRVRRRLREVVRLSGEAALKSGHDYVLIGRREALGMPFERLVEDFKRAVARVHTAPSRAGGPGPQRGRSPKATPHRGPK